MLLNSLCQQQCKCKFDRTKSKEITRAQRLYCVSLLLEMSPIKVKALNKESFNSYKQTIVIISVK